MPRPLSKRYGVLQQSGQCFLHFLLTRVALGYPLVILFKRVLAMKLHTFLPR